MLFAQWTDHFDRNGWAYGLGVLITAFGSAILIPVLSNWWRNRRETRKDAIGEYQIVIARLDADIKSMGERHDREIKAIDERHEREVKIRDDRILRLEDRTDHQDYEIRELQKESSECLRRESDLKRENSDIKGDLARAKNRIATLEQNAGVIPPIPPVLPGVVIANRKGVISSFGAEMTVFLGWKPDEMEGQSIEKMIPPEELVKHRPAFARAAAPGGTIDPTRSVETYALDKTGNRVPVSIALHGWDDPEGLIAATITLRPSGKMKPSP